MPGGESDQQNGKKQMTAKILWIYGDGRSSKNCVQPKPTSKCQGLWFVKGSGVEGADTKHSIELY
jgi:hypothetical protein